MFKRRSGRLLNHLCVRPEVGRTERTEHFWMATSVRPICILCSWVRACCYEKNCPDYPYLRTYVVFVAGFDQFFYV